MRAILPLGILGLLAGLVLAASTADPARACSKRHQTVFELYDQARTVAVYCA